MCGEHFDNEAMRRAASGSSPRVRGTPPSPATVRQPSRFIPACAGNTNTERENAPPITVHPRVCGEHYRQVFSSCGQSGSSPRVRGTRTTCSWRYRSRRFIPACAGNTLMYGPTFPPKTVHPRVCGEHVSARAGTTNSDGSSPRVRGTRHSVGKRTRTERFIPACAGNTRIVRPLRRPAPVHPRVCGEHEDNLRAEHSIDGSSPRVRGTRVRATMFPRTPWFIPACAGNTR